MIALVDCNNFYASCERLFRPDLKGKPVIVLSNNDGCVIARSEEAKRAGIKMGEPAHLAEPLVKQHGVAVFSSNYALYGDMSRRVMATLSMFTPDIEVYSIDEAFLDFSGQEHINLRALAQEIVRVVTKNTGIPIGIGVAPTKTLAKVANKLTKRNLHTKGAWVIHNDPESIEDALRLTEIGDVWGIGWSHKKLMKTNGIETAWDFIQQPRDWVKKHMKVIGLRTWEELRGNPCIQMEEGIEEDKQAICTSRSFGKLQNDYKQIEEAITFHATACAAKLRAQKSCAGMVHVFAFTNEHRQQDPQYRARMWYTLPVPTSSTIDIVRYATFCLKTVYREKDSYGRPFLYKNAGVIVSGIVPENQVQGNIFTPAVNEKHQKLMKALDTITNTMGPQLVQMAKENPKKDRKVWELRREMLSPRFTTRLGEVVQVG